MSRFVVDASIAVKWYLGEVHAKAARRILEADSVLLVPGLFFAEVGNALWKRARLGEFSAADVAATLEALGRVPFDVRSTRSLVPAAMQIALRLGCTVYDAIYLALAQQEDVMAVTADRRLRQAVIGSTLGRYLLWVEDIRGA